MWFTPSSIARRRTARPSAAGRTGPPKVPCARRIAPKPMRRTGRSPPMTKVRRSVFVFCSMHPSSGPASCAGHRVAANGHPGRGWHTGRMAAEMTITVHGEQELAARTGHLFAKPEREFLCAAADLNTWSRREARVTAIGDIAHRVQQGLTIRKLYSSAALTDEEQRLHLLDLRSAGAQVRIAATAL